MFEIKRISERPERPFLRTARRQKELIGMVVPGLLLVFVFSYLPLYGIVIAFQKFNPVKGLLTTDIKWVGLKYFRQFWNGAYTFRLLRNTLLLGVYSLIWCFPTPILLAILLDQLHVKSLKQTVQTISYLPHFLSTVVVIGLVKELFATTGVINYIIKQLGGVPQVYLTTNRWFRTLYIGSGLWQSVGWSSIIYLAALTNVDPQLLEAAIIDGASRFQRVLHVSLPSIAPTISIMLIFAVSGILGNDFTKVLLLYAPSNYEVSDVISTYVYREGLIGGAFEYTTAIGLMMNIVSLVLLTAANQVSRLVNETSLW